MRVASEPSTPTTTGRTRERVDMASPGRRGCRVLDDVSRSTCGVGLPEPLDLSGEPLFVRLGPVDVPGVEGEPDAPPEDREVGPGARRAGREPDGAARWFADVAHASTIPTTPRGE